MKQFFLIVAILGFSISFAQKLEYTNGKIYQDGEQLSSSGTTPYVIGGLEMCNQNNISTGSISCNAESPLSKTAKFPIDVVDGTFVYQKIPTGENDPVIADNDLWDDILVSESTDVNFDQVKNRIIVFIVTGKQIGRAHV